MSLSNPIKRALLSVSDKAGIVEFAKQLENFSVEILSTGGTATLLKQNGISVIDVSEYTGFPELMDSRVKTLHPKIHGGLLGRINLDESVMQQYEIPAIDLLVVNLYPFAKVIKNPECDLATAIENIDIGGPTLLRAGAKNYQRVTVLVDRKDYQNVLTEMKKNHGATELSTRFSLAKKVFAHTALYDATIANYLNAISLESSQNEFPNVYTLQFEKKQDLRYGENPHQKAAFYQDQDSPSCCITSAQQLQGKELSFNNIADADTAFECVKTFAQHACVIVKHANPCGVGVNLRQLDAYEKAFATDPVSAFGGIIAFNQSVVAETAKIIIERQFVEVIIAPDFSAEARELLKQKPAIRILSCSSLLNETVHHKNYDYKRVTGGLLIQEVDSAIITEENLKIVTQRSPTAAEITDLLFAWKVAKYVKSNAIVFAKNLATVGIGAGQMSRVDSVAIAINKANHAGLKIKDSVMASDAFFPFRDGIDQAAAAGATAIIQPGGSIRDAEIIQAADEAGIAMVFTGIRHFRH